ncbi:sugar ABC transporter permease [Paraburkholderia sp. UYCP14C]|uniref:carbohydrate ABC transporter permease n=1 Tax=Paraburkholderia sp. UYCP14C TaxID=2511130 RepID=UPI00101EC444|nr:sugar ABC transporter permease [Paraburkholderia sp. UYCP14C]RZF26908.1 sugar ABC transporter permease [Paraburkholderia sp. UYCP14C]
MLLHNRAHAATTLEDLTNGSGDSPTRKRSTLRNRFEAVLPKIVLSPTLIITLIFVYGFIAWTTVLSFTRSRAFPNFHWAGLLQYGRVWEHPRWHVAIGNLGIYASLYVVLCMAIGLGLAILLDQRIRAEGGLRALFLYPMALSFIVTGTAWKWILNPGLGLAKLFHDWGWSSFQFDWIVNDDMAIYTVVIAAVWQASGFVMAMFLAGLRGIDQEQVKAASIDGARMPSIYRRIIIPQLRPVFVSAFVILVHLAVKSYELVIALTGAGPGYSTELPSTFMYSFTFTRNELGMGAASAVMMLCTVAAIMVPYLYSEMRPRRKSGGH